MISRLKKCRGAPEAIWPESELFVEELFIGMTKPRRGDPRWRRDYSHIPPGSAGTLYGKAVVRLVGPCRMRRVVPLVKDQEGSLKVVYGEPEASNEFAREICKWLGWNVYLPEYLESFMLFENI